MSRPLGTAVLAVGSAAEKESAVLLLGERETFIADGQTRRDRKSIRRELRDQDRVSAKLAELHAIDSLLADATHIIERGWLQHGWFTYVDPLGASHTVTSYTRHTERTVAPEQVTGTCLVGGIVHAAGGPSQSRSQLVQRSIDLTWHAAFRGQHQPVRWCPSPPERAGHVIDLAHWNDQRERTAPDAIALLDRARGLARTEAELTRSAHSVA
jgi:hypothetical protein